MRSATAVAVFLPAGVEGGVARARPPGITAAARVTVSDVGELVDTCSWIDWAKVLDNASHNGFKASRLAPDLERRRLTGSSRKLYSRAKDEVVRTPVG